jgi:acetyltransferase-like isoleucine patch superfamily enzyme
VNLGSGCQIFPSFQIKDAKIIIEENVMAAPNLTIFGAGHPIEDPHGSHIAENVYIKQDAYIGGNVTIRYGITVGRSAVIAAGSVVTKDIPDLEVWGGNPAQFIKKIM